VTGGSPGGASGPAAGTAVPVDARRAALHAAQLAALVTARWGPAERRSHALGAGAALTGELDGVPAAWVLAGARPERSLGPALLWAERQGAELLHLIATAGAGVVARQAALFMPSPAVFAVEGTALVPAEPAPVPRPSYVPPPAELVDLLVDAGLEIVVEGGLVRGEVEGLEVARVATGRTSAGVPIDAPVLEVGVGQADRELTALVHGELAPVDQLARVVTIVRRHRRPGAPPHPLNRLVPERWLRAALCRQPSRLELATLAAAAGPRPRPNLRDRDVAVAAGETPTGAPAVVVCSVGVALDLVPEAADARAALDPGARLVLAVPERDDLPVNRRLAARLTPPAEVVAVPDTWWRSPVPATGGGSLPHRAGPSR
jgi:hypothetical protein